MKTEQKIGQEWVLKDSQEFDEVSVRTEQNFRLVLCDIIQWKEGDLMGTAFRPVQYSNLKCMD